MRIRTILASVGAAATVLLAVGAASGAGMGGLTNTLTVVGDADGSGRVTATGIDCTITGGVASGDCTQNYLVGAQVAVTPEAAPLSIFYFCLIGTSAHDCSVTMSADTTLKVRFGRGHLVDVQKTGTGTGTVKATINGTANGIDCGSVCSYLYGHLKVSLVLTPTVAPGSAFAGWGGACSGTPTTEPCNLTLNSNALSELSLTARFDMLGSPGSPGAGPGMPGDTSPGSGSTGGESSGTTDATLDAQLVAVAVGKSALGRRLVRVELSADEAISVRLSISRSGKVLAQKKVRQFTEGRRVVELPIAKGARRGRATLTVTLLDAAGNEQTLTRAIRIPKR